MDIFYGQADREGVEAASPIGPDCKQMWKFWSIFSCLWQLNRWPCQSVSESDVEFVHTVSAGGSVKFLPAV